MSENQNQKADCKNPPEDHLAAIHYAKENCTVADLFCYYNHKLTVRKAFLAGALYEKKKTVVAVHSNTVAIPEPNPLAGTVVPLPDSKQWESPSLLLILFQLLWPPLLVVAVTLAFIFYSESAGAACRSAEAKHKFDVQQGYPHGRKGFVVDHICALEQGGIDGPPNLQYQTVFEGHIKDKVELTPQGRKMFCNPTNSSPTRQVFNCKKKKQ